MDIKKEGTMLLVFVVYIILLFIKKKCEKTQYVKAAIIAAVAILVEVILDILPYMVNLDAVLIGYSVLQWIVTNIVFALAVGIIYKLICKEPSKLWELYQKRLPVVKIGILLMFFLGIGLTSLNCYYLLVSMSAIKEVVKGGNLNDMLFLFSVGDMQSNYSGIIRIFKILIPGCIMMDLICRKDESVAK